MLEVQKYLLGATEFCSDLKALDLLKDDTGVKSNIWNNLVVLNYSQFDSKKACEISSECRSLVLELGTWEVVSRSFDSFFNYGEDPCPEIDGSLIGLFKYKGEWLYRTRSMIMPEGSIEAALQGVVTNTLYDTYTYILELTSEENRGVLGVTPTVTLSAVQDNVAGWYPGKMGLECAASDMGIQLTRSYKFDDIVDYLRLEISKNYKVKANGEFTDEL